METTVTKLIEKITLSNTKNDEVIVLKHFHMCAEEESVVKEFSDKGINVDFGPIYPDEWESLTYQEKVTLADKHIFPLVVNAVYLNKEYQATDEDIEKLKVFPSLGRVWIASNSVSAQGLKELKYHKHLHTLILYSNSATDELYETLMLLENLVTFDVQDSRMTQYCLDKLGIDHSSLNEIYGPDLYHKKFGRLSYEST